MNPLEIARCVHGFKRLLGATDVQGNVAGRKLTAEPGVRRHPAAPKFRRRIGAHPAARIRRARVFLAAALLATSMTSWCRTSALAATADAPFTIGNYPVEAVAKDAVQAKERALADGQLGAFRSLLRRLVPVTAYRRLAKLTPPRTAELVDGFSVRSERNSSTQYIASLDFAFQPQAVRSFLKREGLPFVDTQAPEIVVVPVLRNGQGASIDAGPWSDAWKGLDLGHTLAPVKIQPLKEAIHADTVKMAMADDSGGADRILAGEYQTDRVVLAIADVDPATKRVHIVLAGQDAVGRLRLKRSWRLGSDQGYTLELAAVVSLGVLEGRWKATQAAQGGDGYAGNAYGSGAAAPWSVPGGDGGSGNGPIVRLAAEFGSIGQWNEIRSQILDTPGVDGVEIGAMTARSAEINLRYPGGGEQLARALAAQGLVVRNSGGVWRLTAD